MTKQEFKFITIQTAISSVFTLLVVCGIFLAKGSPIDFKAYFIAICITYGVALAIWYVSDFMFNKKWF